MRVGLVLLVLRPVDVAHITRGCDLLMERKASIETLRRMTLHSEVEVVTQQLLVVGVYALLDDLLSTLAGALTTEVSDTVLGDDDLHRVLTVVEVRDHRYEGRDLAVLSGRRRGEDREIAIASEVA